MRVNGGTPDKCGVTLEANLSLLVEEGDDALDLGHHLGADAVARQQQK
jgi:hypothetical protein